MFTGLVEGQGTVVAATPEGPAVRLTVAVPPPFVEPSDRFPGRVGNSVAVNGCCLTVVALAGANWSFEAGPETLARTNLGRLHPGDAVNLERPLRLTDELGGHFVQGHIDGTAEVVSVQSQGEWTDMRFRLPGELARYLVPKGSVAIDGVSLTVVEAGGNHFSVALIPHTLEVTTLGRRRPGDVVNIETDLLAKYVERLMEAVKTP